MKEAWWTSSEGSFPSNSMVTNEGTGGFKHFLFYQNKRELMCGLILNKTQWKTTPHKTLVKDNPIPMFILSSHNPIVIHFAADFT